MKTAKELLAYTVENRGRLADEFLERLSSMTEAEAAQGRTSINTRIGEGIFSHAEYIQEKLRSLGYFAEFGGKRFDANATQEHMLLTVSWDDNRRK